MRGAKLTVPWGDGLHARPAVGLVKIAKASKSSILVKLGDKVANARSILALLLLSATPGAILDIEVKGEDEDTVLASITRMFDSDTAADRLAREGTPRAGDDTHPA